MGLEALASCVLSGVALPWQGLPDTRTAPWLCYAQHLIFTLLTIAATVPHILIAWLQRPGTELASGASGWLRMGLWVLAAGLYLIAALSFAYSGTKYCNEFPAGYNFLFGRDRPFAPSLARTSTNGAFDPRSLACSETCGASGCHTQIYAEWKPSAHRYEAMVPVFQASQSLMAKQNGPESTRYCGGCPTRFLCSPASGSSGSCSPGARRVFRVFRRGNPRLLAPPS